VTAPIIGLLINFYTGNYVLVVWSCIVSNYFLVVNGVKQGGVLNPVLSACTSMSCWCHYQQQESDVLLVKLLSERWPTRIKLRSLPRLLQRYVSCSPFAIITSLYRRWITYLSPHRWTDLQVHSAQSSLVVTHLSTKRGRHALTSVNVPCTELYQNIECQRT